MKLTIQNIKIIGEYFQTTQDFINIMMTCKKFRGLTELYESNPIQNCTLFPNITTQIFYDTLDIYQHKNSYGLLPNILDKVLIYFFELVIHVLLPSGIK